MRDPIPGHDPNEAYDVIPTVGWPHGWWTVTCNGIPVWHCARREAADHYARDPEHRASLVTKKLWERGKQMPTIDQRLETLLSNLEAAQKTTPPEAPHLMLLLQLKELAGIVAQMRANARD